MAGEVFQERQPVILVGLLVGLGLNKLDAAGGLVVVIKTHGPRNHRIAANQAINADVLAHEGHPLVEYGIVIAPRAVQLLGAAYHTVVMVLRLSVPRFVHNAGGDGILTHVGQHLHDGAHQVEVLLAPQGDIVVTGHGIRILPQVQVEGPILRGGQGAIQYLHLQRQRQILIVGRRHRQRTAVLAGACIGRHIDLHPNRTGTVGPDIHLLGNVQHVGHKG